MAEMNTRIGILCRTPVVRAAVELTMQRTHNFFQVSGDDSIYTLGTLGGKEVAITSLPLCYSVSDVSVSRTNILRTFGCKHFFDLSASSSDKEVNGFLTCTVVNDPIVFQATKSVQTSTLVKRIEQVYESITGEDTRDVWTLESPSDYVYHISQRTINTDTIPKILISSDGVKSKHTAALVAAVLTESILSAMN